MPRSRHPRGRPPWCRACWEIRSTRGRYASYWNAILCCKIHFQLWFQVFVWQSDTMYSTWQLWETKVSLHIVSQMPDKIKIGSKLKFNYSNKHKYVNENNSLCRNLLSNPFNCNCHLGWLSEWLRKKNLVTGNPRCLAPSFLKDMPIQDLKPTDFKCESKNCWN